MLRYWIWLTTRKGLGTRGASLVAGLFPNPEQAYLADAEVYTALGLRNFEPLLDKDLTETNEILQRCYSEGISLITFQDAAYPQQLRALSDPPMVLYYRGQLPDFSTLLLAVVGTRRATPYGQLQARKLGYALGRCGAVLVSGCARGIDITAMEAALSAGGTVVGIMGCGVDVPYPRENSALYRDIAYHGCLISEYPPGTTPRPEFFPVRNRLISGLSMGVVVVEAPARSGSLITAQRALDQGRDVFALPGNVDSDACAGNVSLLRDGAILVRDARDILEEYEQVFPDILQKCQDLELEQQENARLRVAQPVQRPEPLAQEPAGLILDSAVLAGLSDDESAVLEQLREMNREIDDIVDETQLPSGRALAALTLLEVKGLVRRLPGRRFGLTGSIEQ